MQIEAIENHQKTRFFNILAVWTNAPEENIQNYQNEAKKKKKL